MTVSQRWFVLACVGGLGAVVFLLGPVLTPFAVAALLAYVGDPLVDALERRKVPRTLGVVIVFLVLFLGLAVALVIVIPRLENQITTLIRGVPGYIDWFQQTVMPKISAGLGVEAGFAGLKEAVTENWQRAGGFAFKVLSDVSRSGAAVLGWLANLVLIPVVTFYLLRDWNRLVDVAHDLLPRSVEPTVSRLTREADRVLAAFFRGQILVMLGLAFIYTVGLTIVGLNLALLIGLVAGLVSFVPYLGLLVGVIAAGSAAFFQFQEVLPVLYACAVFGVGQVVEGMVLTPLLVGDRIGLHPVAVIFAVLAGGQLFGFVGVLLALPVAAVVVVLLRHVHRSYLDSELYRP